MLDFFQSIIDVFTTLWGIVSNFFTGILQFLSMIPQIFSFLYTMQAYVPSIFTVFFIAGFSVSIVLLVVNRKT